jgi:L-rhamnose mutarotase
MTLNRYCFALDLQDDAALIERYKVWHQPGQVPAAIVASIRDADIRSLEIWQAGDRMFMIMETGPEFSAGAKATEDAASEDVQAWERLMWEFQKPLPFAKAGEKWVEMTRIFDLIQQP